MSARFASWPAWTLLSSSLAMFVENLALALLCVTPSRAVPGTWSIGGRVHTLFDDVLSFGNGRLGKGRTTVSQ
jgi:hypothetical protein